MTIDAKEENRSLFEWAGKNSRPIALCLAVLLVAYHLMAIARFGTAVIDGDRYFLVDDDAMITMRYGRSLARGDGLVFNPGEHVEGFTNPLMAFVTAGFHLLPIAPRLLPLLIDLINLALSVLILLGLSRFWGDSPTGRFAGMVGALFYTLLSQHGFYAYAGYEVYMQAAILLLCLMRFERLGYGGALLLGLLPLTHATMVVAWAILVVALAVKKGETGRKRWILVGLSVAPFAAYEIFRVFYYHDFLPNTYWLKVGAGSISGGVRYALGWIARVFPIIFVAIFALRKPRTGTVNVILVVLSANVLEAIALGGDIFPQSRFLFPSSVLLAALAGWGAAQLLHGRAADNSPRKVPMIAIAAAIILAIVLPVVSMKSSAEEYLSVDRWEIQHIAMGIAIRDNTPPESVVALFGLGYAGYYCDRPTIDMLGKADRHIAHTKAIPGRRLAHNKSDFVYVMGRKPEVVELAMPPEDARNDQLLSDPRQRRSLIYNGDLARNSDFRAAYVSNPIRDLKGRFCRMYAREGSVSQRWTVSEALFDPR